MNTSLIVSILHGHVEVFHVMFPIEYDMLTESEIEFEGKTYDAGTPPF